MSHQVRNGPRCFQTPSQSLAGSRLSSERYPTRREILVTAHCSPGEPKGPHLGTLFIGHKIIEFGRVFILFCPQYVLGDSGILAATVQFQHFPDCTVLASTHQSYDPGSRSSGTVKQCPIVPTHCSCNQDKESSKSPQLTTAVTKPSHHVGVCQGRQVARRGGCTTTDADSEDNDSE